METVTLTLTLPRELATEAGQAGLLTADSLVALLKREVRQRRINNLFAAIDRLDQKNTDILDIDEIFCRNRRRSGGKAPPCVWCLTRTLSFRPCSGTERRGIFSTLPTHPRCNFTHLFHSCSNLTKCCAVTSS